MVTPKYATIMAIDEKIVLLQRLFNAPYSSKVLSNVLVNVGHHFPGAS